MRLYLVVRRRVGWYLVARRGQRVVWFLVKLVARLRVSFRKDFVCIRMKRAFVKISIKIIVAESS
jgi:hypothetical protein